MASPLLLLTFASLGGSVAPCTDNDQDGLCADFEGNDNSILDTCTLDCNPANGCEPPCVNGRCVRAEVGESCLAVYLFSRTDRDADWRQRGTLKPSNTDSEDEFGGALSLSGEGVTLAVGARREGSGAGSVGGHDQSNLLMDSGAVYVRGVAP